jgi:short subunit dehydrogenase-like uncharacterized protein
VGTIGLLGATGYTGRLAARSLSRRGLAFIAAGRDPQRLHEVAAAVEGVRGTRVVDVHAPGELGRLTETVDVLVTTVGPFVELGRPVLEAAIAGGAHYIDSTGEQPFVRWVFEEQDDAARQAGVAAVPACGFDFVPGDLLAAVAASRAGPVREVHVVYLVEVGPRTLSAGTRRSIAKMIGRDGVAWDRGRLVEERFADVRRLAWFPRPVGPRRAAGFPGGEPITVPRHVGGVETVRSYVAVPGIVAELGQTLATVARWGPIRRAVARALEIGAEGPDPERRKGVRWACVAEAVPPDGAVVRAWAAGRDIYAFTADAMAAVAHRLVDDPAASGVLAPAQVTDPVTLLDDLAMTTGMRWTVVDPE